MGVDATYIVPYKRGLLKRLYVEVSKKQHYHCEGQPFNYQLVRGKGGDNVYKFMIKCDDGWSTSTIRFYPVLRLLEVDDMCRYYGKENEEHHRKVEAYFVKLLRDLGAKEWVYVHTMPDWTDVQTHGVCNDGDEVKEDEALFEVPHSLLTSEERRHVVLMYGSDLLEGKAAQKEWEDTVENALAEGNKEFVESWFERWRCGEVVGKYTWGELVVMACRAKASNCLEIFLRGKTDEMSVPRQAMEIAVRNVDRSSILSLLKGGCKPTEDDLYEIAHKGRKVMFLEMLEHYVPMKRDIE